MDEFLRRLKITFKNIFIFSIVLLISVSIAILILSFKITRIIAAAITLLMFFIVILILVGSFIYWLFIEPFRK
jgi:TRAP-type C4-dicarboxylate transport system permease small subunit